MLNKYSKYSFQWKGNFGKDSVFLSLSSSMLMATRFQSYVEGEGFVSLIFWEGRTVWGNFLSSLKEGEGGIKERMDIIF